MSIILKSPQEVEIMRQAGKILAAILPILTESIYPGMKTRELDTITIRELKKRGARSSFKGYRGYPANLCVSVNDEIVHGIPGERVLKEGDIVSLDVGAFYQGFHADAAITVGVGEISTQARGLLTLTRGALTAGIAAARGRSKLSDISSAIQLYAESRGGSVVREYGGHGVGRELHEDPHVPNFGFPVPDIALKRGMTLALEPMVNIGTWQTRVAPNHWTVLTSDGTLSAHFEHTVAITDGEPEVLTAF